MNKQEERMKLKCKRCGHEWVRRNLDKLPDICPNRKCKSRYWDRPRQEKKA